MCKEIKIDMREHSNVCINPACGSYNITSESTEIGTNVAWQSISCLDCETSWDEDYKADGISDVKIPGMTVVEKEAIVYEQVRTAIISKTHYTGADNELVLNIKDEGAWKFYCIKEVDRHSITFILPSDTKSFTETITAIEGYGFSEQMVQNIIRVRETFKGEYLCFDHDGIVYENLHKFTDWYTAD